MEMRFYFMDQNTEVKLCGTCVRNINSKFVGSKEGQCLYCREFAKHRPKIEKMMEGIKGKFQEEIKKNRAGQYDCLVMVSGGKDSVMALYILAMEMKLRPLAFMVDNGFEDEACLENVRHACDKLGADWFLDRPACLKKTIRAALLETMPASICRFCVPIMVNRAIKMARAFGIPYIVTGWNKGQSDKEPSRRALWNIPDGDVHNLASKYDLGENIGLCARENEELLKKFNIKIISPWIFQKRDPEKNIKILEKELSWKKTKFSYPKDSTSCKLNLLQVILSRKKFGFTHYDCEESMLINYGEKNKEQALKTLDFDIDRTVVKDVLEAIGLTAKQIGLKKGEIERYSKFFF